MVTAGPLNLTDLARRLEAAGASPANYALSTRPYDGYCLLHEGGEWRVCYTERGQDSPAIFTSPDEAAACQFYFEFTMKMRHQHLVAYLGSRPAADAVQARLTGAGIASTRDQLYYAAPDDYRQRVFVWGTDIFAARRVLGNQLPLEDEAAPDVSWWARLWHWVC